MVSYKLTCGCDTLKHNNHMKLNAKSIQQWRTFTAPLKCHIEIFQTLLWVFNTVTSSTKAQ